VLAHLFGQFVVELPVAEDSPEPAHRSLNPGLSDPFLFAAEQMFSGVSSLAERPVPDVDATSSGIALGLSKGRLCTVDLYFSVYLK
jgi:hypothetical protein